MKKRIPGSRRLCLLAVILPLLLNPARAQSNSEESAHLAAILRQLDAIEKSLSQTSASNFNRPNSRYHFDYQRATHDVSRIRTGIHDYLNPSRAQPRDPVEITGSYNQEDTQ